MQSIRLWVMTALLAAGVQAEDKRPNVLLVLADDLGYGDLACYGNTEVQTPELDAFAASGLKLTQCYASHPNCSPSRAGLMTGRTPTRLGIRDWIPEQSPAHLKREEVTVATLLHRAGYRTCLSGKWHLNGWFNDPRQPQPNDHGFDHWFATQNNAYPNHHNPVNFVRNGEKLGLLEGYAADLVADEAIHWLREGRDSEQPFFLYVAFHEPHEPIATAPKYASLYPNPDPAYSAHHGNITQMDAAFGRLMRALEELGAVENTLVVFTSDNGPAITAMHPYGSSGPLRDKKGSMWEGGIRVPGIMRWPGRIKPGSTSDEPVCGVDFLPSMCDLLNLPLPAGRALDGASFLPVWTGEKIHRQVPLYWQFNRASGGPKVAVRQGDWKLVAALDRPPNDRETGFSEAIQNDVKESELVDFQLYNLANDIAENSDRASRDPEVMERLQALMLPRYREVRAETVVWPDWVNPGVEGPQIQWPDYVLEKRKKKTTK
ncbi:MAG: sulfatase-like hydrolase/transferase [Verrucomicrobiales bacterium]|nr:sulfatase-like hydrolase/transferase [Verrucomicrobiales bacterium]